MLFLSFQGALDVCRATLPVTESVTRALSVTFEVRRYRKSTNAAAVTAHALRCERWNAQQTDTHANAREDAARTGDCADASDPSMGCENFALLGTENFARADKAANSES